MKKGQMSKKALDKRSKEAQQDLLQASKMLSLGQMAAGAVHEIKNILFVISGQIEILEMEEGLSPLAKQTTQSMRQQVSQMQGIVRRLLDFSRKKEIQIQECDVNELLKGSVELLRYQIKERDRVKVIEEFAKESLIIKGDADQLNEVFLNLMINAAQAMEEKGGVLTVRSYSKIFDDSSSLAISKIKKGDKVAYIEFSDTGVGMSEKTKKKIFDPFFTTKKEGTGLGLSLCFNIIKDHGGTIEAESQQGAGTTFTVRIPLAKITSRK